MGLHRMNERDPTKIGNLAIKVARVVVVSARAQMDGARQRSRSTSRDQLLDTIIAKVGGYVDNLTCQLPIQV